MKTRAFFLAAFLALLSLATVALSSAFAYHPVAVSSRPAEPPVVFGDPGTPGVGVVLGTNGTSAEVSVPACPGCSLELVNPVVYHHTLDAGLPPGWTMFRATTWGYTTTAWVRGALSGTSTDRAYAFYGSTIVDGSYNGFYYAAAYIRTTDTTRYVGVSFIGRSGTYTFAATCEIGTWSGYGNFHISYQRFEDGALRRDTAVSYTSVTLTTGKWYVMVCAVNPATREARAYLYDPAAGTLMASLSGTFPVDVYIPPYTAGFFVYMRLGQYGYYDEFVVTRDYHPLSITVLDVPSGWTVRLYNGTSLLQSVTSTGAPVVFDRFWWPQDGQRSTILRQGRIEVYDEAGNLVASYGPTTIVGGQVFRLRCPRVLDVLNLDSKSYYGALVLHGYSAPLGLRVYLCSTSKCSTPVVVPPGPRETSEVGLPPQGVGYVLLHCYQPPAAPAEVYLYLRYSSLPGGGGVLVYYPIRVVVGR